jgi:hypothetical protein
MIRIGRIWNEGDDKVGRRNGIPNAGSRKNLDDAFNGLPAIAHS